MALSQGGKRRENMFMEKNRYHGDRKPLVALRVLFGKLTQSLGSLAVSLAVRVVPPYPMYLKGSTPLNVNVRFGGGTSCLIFLSSFLLVLDNVLMMVSNAREDLSTDVSFLCYWYKSITILECNVVPC